MLSIQLSLNLDLSSFPWACEGTRDIGDGVNGGVSGGVNGGVNDLFISSPYAPRWNSYGSSSLERGGITTQERVI
jgi:hypothetical protein